MECKFGFILRNIRHRTFMPSMRNSGLEIGIRPPRLLNGSLPPAKLALVLAWAKPRSQVLLDTWYTVLAKKNPGKIR